MAACGGDFSGPTRADPTPPPTYPSVGGDYSGTVTIALSQLPQPVSCPATTTLAQSQDVVNVMPIVMTGAAFCVAASPLQVARIVIDTNGRIPSFPQTANAQVDCGTYTIVTDGGFSGNEFRLSQALTSTTCPQVTYTILLVRR